MLSNYDAYAILIEPFEGYGAPYIWGIYRSYDNARKKLEQIAENNDMSFSTIFDNDTAYNNNAASLKNRISKASIQGDFFKD